MDNLRIWNRVSKPPANALKEIKAGRIKGMTDINPQWRMEAMTEVFGPCGDGWKYTVDKVWNEPGPLGEVFAFAQVSVYYKITTNGQPETWSEAIPGLGGSMLVAKESSGLHASDEAYKMAITDALSVALKALGVGSEIYRGRWDGSKYRDDTSAPAKPASTPPPPANVAKNESPVNDDTREKIWAMLLKVSGGDTKAASDKLRGFSFQTDHKKLTDKQLGRVYRSVSEEYDRWKSGTTNTSVPADVHNDLPF